MRERRLVQCDVFSEIPLKGNGLAVVVEGTGLDDQVMQDFAAWTNLSETTYLLPPTHPDADYKLRIFTPMRELAFAGHPTLGSCAAWLHAGGVPKRGGLVVQECNIGNVTIDNRGPLPGFVAPPTRINPMPADLQAQVLAALGIAPEMLKSAVILDNGSLWHLLELDEAAAVLAVSAAKVATLPGLGIGLLAASPANAASQFDIRMLSERTPGFEDPITGSLNAAVGMWLLSHGRLAQPTIIAQGVKVARIGQVHLLPGAQGSGQVLVAGRTHILIDGKVRL
ncbi:PhzF family phenazine biosynthesis protein [Cypionkella psychrotolerans]|uniref:PhzF family phenazine biosynthesis protein n=1 Tax=Cypionkella psychrotolerans TaxID=1678131 RepID=UPI0006B42B74|nr:PhzF family phenazine biosynthesis protein [Cypionkella psychrotolerans]